MKRIGNLYQQIYTLENLTLAWYKAQRGKSHKADVLFFRCQLAKNIENLSLALQEKKITFNNYHFFTIYEPKERCICAVSFPDRVIHHAIMNILDPYFENFQIFDSYACRLGKGVHSAVKRAFYFTKKYRYFVKMDVKKFFDSIDHKILQTLLENRFKDPNVLWLFNALIASYTSSATGTAPKGLPIGNLSSQYFANYYLGLVDHFIKEKLQIKAYLRYMDDMLIFGNSLPILQKQKTQIENFVHTALDLSLKQNDVVLAEKGVPYCGFLIKPTGIFLLHKAKQRFKKKAKKLYSLLKTQRISSTEYSQRIQPTNTIDDCVDSTSKKPSFSPKSFFCD